MNKIKIITIAAVGLLPRYAQTVDLKFTTNDGKQMMLSKDTACISASIKNLCNDLCDEDGNVHGVIPLGNVSEQEFKQVMEHQVNDVLETYKRGLTLNNIGELSYRYREEKGQKAARALPAVETSREDLPKRLKERLANLKVVHYLDIPELIERDACMIACMLRSAESRRLLLGKNEQSEAYKAIVQNINDPKHRELNNSFATKIYQYMPHELWLMHCELPHNEYAVTPENLVGVFSVNGQDVVTKSLSDRLAIFWDADSGNIKFTLQYDGMISPDIFSSDGKRLIVAAGNDAKLCTFSDKGALQVDKVLRHGSRVKSAVFSRDGTKIATAAGNFGRIWDVKTGKQICNPLQHEASLCAAVFSPIENCMMTAAQNGVVRIWDASSGDPLKTWNQQDGENANIEHAVFSPDGKKIGIMFANQRVKVIDVERGEQLVAPKEHTGGFMQAVFSSDGSKIVTVSGSTVNVFDAQNGAPLLTLPHQGSVGLAIFSPVGDKVLTVSGKKISIFDAQEGTPLSDMVQKNEITSAVFSPDGTRLLITDDNIGIILNLIPAHTFDQALLAWLISKDGRIPAGAWAEAVMNVYSPAEQKLIKEMIRSRKSADKKCTIS